MFDFFPTVGYTNNQTLHACMLLFVNIVCTQQTRENGTFLQVLGTQGLELLFQYLL
jgi:hypothetical protein